LGFSRSLLNPLALLAVYTSVFSAVLHTRWLGTMTETSIEFPLIVFAGLAIARAPDVIVVVPNYVLFADVL
jgi:ABC-type polysaccharide/polyol phosphate export permease